MIKYTKGLLFLVALIFTQGLQAQVPSDSTLRDSSKKVEPVIVDEPPVIYEPPVIVDYDEGIDTTVAADTVAPAWDGDIPGYPLNLRDEDLSSFQVLDSIADNHRFIFTGEDHRVEKLNTTLELRMMTYLHSRGYRYYLMEAGYASEWLINRYIVDQDSAAEEALRNYYTPNFFDMFVGMRLVNDTLPKEQRIRAVALDIERDVPLALKMLWMLLPEKQASDSMEMFVESLKMFAAIQEAQSKEGMENAPADDKDLFDFGGFNFDFYSEGEYEYQEEKYFYFKMISTVTDLTRRFRNNDKEFREFLGDNYAQCARVITELENWLVWVKYEQEQMPQSWVFREQYMEKNFRTFFAPRPEAKAFGQFGRCHVTRITRVGDCGFAFFSSLNKRLISKMPDLKNQVVSIGIFYPGLETEKDFEQNGNVNMLADQTEAGTAALYLDIQELGDDELYSKFSHVIIAKSSNTDTEYKGEWTRKKVTRTGIEVNFGTKQFDFTNFNRQLNSNLSGEMTFWSIGTDVRKNHGFCTKSTLTFYSKNETKFGDTASIFLKGWNYHTMYGYDLLRARWLDLVPMLGFGFEQLKYAEKRTALGSSYFGSEVVSEYRNPAFYFDARLELNLNVSFITLKAFGGYAYDVSNKKWKGEGGKISASSPSTSMSGYYFGFGVALCGID